MPLDYVFPQQVGTAYIVPTMANTKGRFGAHFKTKVVLSNPTAHNYDVQMILCGPSGMVDRQFVNVTANSYTEWDNFLEEVFQYTGNGGVLFSAIDPSGNTDGDRYRFYISAVVYNDSPQGRYFTLVSDGHRLQYIPLRQQAYLIYHDGITSNDQQRVNIGAFNHGRQPLTIYASVRGENDTAIETNVLEVPARGWAQKPIKAKFERGRIVWWSYDEPAIAGTGLYIQLWAVIVNNQSNDGVLLKPHFVIRNR